MTLMLFSGAWGKMIHEKNLKQKILWLCPFKVTESPLDYLFLEVYKIAPLVFKVLWCLVEEKNKCEDCECFYENLH
jgi:hypothetical protein